MTKPLEGIKVLDFSEQGYVPSAAAALADFGANVIKIERPTGDKMRTIISSGIVPTVDGYDYLFEFCNRNKRGICIDVETEGGRAVFERLVRWAEVYITNHLPRVRRKLRTEPDDLMAINPKLVYAKGHGQGQRGADAEAGGYDGVSYWARGGMAHLLTAPDATAPAQQRPALGDFPPACSWRAASARAWCTCCGRARASSSTAHCSPLRRGRCHPTSRMRR